MLLFFKSTSRTVNQDDVHEPDYEACTSLTVWRKSLLLSCKGFTVIGSDGSLAYRVDNYTGRPDQVTLMDGSGHPILTMLRRKKQLGLVDNWFIFEGEVDEYSSSNNNKKKTTEKKPIYVVRKNMNILQGNFNVLAYVYRGNNICDKRHSSYVVEGSYANRACKVLDESKRIVAEIKKKEAMVGSADVSFGLEVFLLIVHPGFDSGFAMSLILLLDQMFS